MTSSGAGTRRAQRGLGWPGDPASRRDSSGTQRRTGLGWPGDGPSPTQPVPRETSPLSTSGTAFGPAPAPGTPDYPKPAGFDAPSPGASQSAAAVSPTPQHQRLPGLPKPAETRVLAVANQKGGVGKTTTAVNVAAALALRGSRVLVVDLDPQGNASTALGIDHAQGAAGVYEAIVADASLGDLVRPCPDVAGLFVIPATIDLAGAEIELVSLPEREHRLRQALDAYLSATHGEQRPDYIVIDCPPSLGLLTVNALVAAKELLVPIQCEYYALEGVGQLLRNVDLIRSALNPTLVVSTVLLTMYDGRTRLSAAVAEEVRAHFGKRVLRTTIPRSVRISEAPSYSQTVMTYDPSSPGALCYLEVARELASQPTLTSSSKEAS